LISFSLDVVKDQLNNSTSTINFLITLFQDLYDVKMTCRSRQKWKEKTKNWDSPCGYSQFLWLPGSGIFKSSYI